MLMNPPTVPIGYVNAPSYDDLVNTLQLIRHATAPTPDDDAYHENAHDLADDIPKKVEARRKQDGASQQAPQAVEAADRADERTQFEAAVARLREWPDGYFAPDFFACWDSGDYKTDWLEKWWAVWRAARQAVESQAIEAEANHG